jgi:hypothetical protein
VNLTCCPDSKPHTSYKVDLVFPNTILMNVHMDCIILLKSNASEFVFFLVAVVGEGLKEPW